MTQQQNIFVVDDEAAARDMIGDYLKMQGFNVTLCDGGKSLRAAVERAKPDLVVLDLNMPEEDGLSLVRFLKGSGIPSRHSHASNQFMFCLSGRYTYTPTGLTLTEGSFYWNPKGSLHGPTLAEEESVLLEIYDGPHYPTQPEWYTDPQDAR